jgi:cation transporter-like permease
MKKQITRFSPHQNAKVFAILMALGSLVFLVPFMLIALAQAPAGGGPPWYLVLIFPVVYLVFGYLSIAVACWIYNTMYPHIGGIEFDIDDTA